MSNIDVIQIGANSGLTKHEEDIIWPIVREKNWKCIFIEPIPSAFRKLKENYADLEGSFFEEVAIMDFNGDTTIFYEGGDGGDTRIASTSAQHAPGRNKANVSVQCRTLQFIVEKYDMMDVPFELLQIDTEGADGLILTSTDFEHILPKHIRFENCHLGKRQHSITEGQVITHLEKFGYKKIDDIYEKSGTNLKEHNIDTLMERQDG